MATVSKRGSNSWRLTVYAGKDLKGKYIRHTKTVTCNTKRQAELELAKFQVEIETGLYIVPHKLTLFEFIEEWKTKYAKATLEKNTLRRYTRLLELRVIPVIGHLQLQDIKPMHIISLISEIQQPGQRLDNKEGKLSSSSVYYVYRVLKNVFNRAVEWGILKQSPLSSIKSPSVTYKESDVYNEVEVRYLLDLLNHEEPHWRMMILLAITTGLRRGELVGLEWKHIDLELGVISVRQSITMFENGQPYIKLPKTKKSIRNITLSDLMVQELKAYQEHCLVEWDSLKSTRNEKHFFVFFNHYGQAFQPQSPYSWFRNFIKKHNLKYIKFHDLRHTSATLLISKGVHAKVISERLGHSNISTTMNIYGHVLQEADREAANKFDGLW